MHPRRRGVSCRTDEGIDPEFLPLRLVSVGLTGTCSGSIVKAAGTILTCLQAWRCRALPFISDRGLLFSDAEHGADAMVTVHSISALMRAWQYAKSRTLAVVAKEVFTIYATLMMSLTRCRGGILSWIICNGATARRSSVTPGTFPAVGWRSS